MATMTMDYRSAGPAPVRLTARGRAVVRVALALLLVAIGIASVGNLNVGRVFASTASVTVSPAHTVVVRQGETLWQIAAREMPGIDTREGIARIRERNGMSTRDVLAAGSTLTIPRS